MLGVFGKATIEAQVFIDAIAPESASGTKEVGAREVDESQSGQDFAAGGSLVAAVVSTSTGPSGAPFFSESAIWCWRVAVRVSRRNCRPSSKRNASHWARIFPRGAWADLASSFAAKSRAIWAIWLWNGDWGNNGDSGILSFLPWRGNEGTGNLIHDLRTNCQVPLTHPEPTKAV